MVETEKVSDSGFSVQNRLPSLSPSKEKPVWIPRRDRQTVHGPWHRTFSVDRADGSRIIGGKEQ
jgi:hypothetical protein